MKDDIQPLDRFNKLWNNLVEETFIDYSKQLELSEAVTQIRQRELAKLPFHINVIQSAAVGRLHETAHSRILRDLLLHPSVQRSFLQRFLELDFSTCEIDREKDNIDLALHDNEHFVIIENKVNDAVEQEHQVYRYVQTALVDYHYKPEQVYVIYLNSRTHEVPTVQSLCDGDPNTDVRRILGDRFVVISFTDDIVNWLSGLSFPQEPYLHSAIYQYIDYINRHFELLDEYSDMKKKIDDFLAKELQLNDLSYSERAKVLEDRREDVQSILDSLNRLIQENVDRMRADKLQAIKDNLVKLYPQFANRLTDFQAPDALQFHLLLSNGFTLAIESTDRVYWCLCNSSCEGQCEVTDGQKAWAKSVLEPIGKTNYSPEGHFYIAWDYTETPVNDFIEIFNSILNNTKVTPL